ncbi:MAG: aminotransferase class V-fold PLP-dependent enzyme [Sporomusaceae bacterium]|jgi:cysteine desulfurase|nr:aminotransferase class V-fold PLP-dependent enzyme [Sporomusaceae bacterium]
MFFTKKNIYLDNTATTRTRREVIAEMNKYFSAVYANPSSIHQDGLIARGSLEMARERIAGALGCLAAELIFTGSGSESNNLAIRGAAKALAAQGRHLVTSKIEHSSVLNTCRALAKDGWEVTYLDVDTQGRLDLKQLSAALRPDTVLVSLVYVNNDIGTIQDAAQIVKLVKGKQILLHLDGVQALPYLPLDLTRLGADLVSFSGHKLYAPKGVGLLYCKTGTPLEPIIYGGGQEFDFRSGSENVPYIVGLSKAIELNTKEKEAYTRQLTAWRDRLINGVLASVPDSLLTGDAADRAPNHASFCFKGVNGKMLVKELSWRGFDVASGSACSSARNTPSHVLLACRIPEDYLYGSIRVTLGRYNSGRDITKFLRVLPEVVAKMRAAKIPYENAGIFISQAELRTKLSAGEHLQLLDVRPVKYPWKMIPGSLHIPHWRLQGQLRKLDPAAETVVVCYQGDILSPEAQQLLVKNGFKNVKVLQGGLDNYPGELI